MESDAKSDNFPTLIPAFTVQIVGAMPIAVTSSLIHFPFAPDSGLLASAPGYPIPLRASFVAGVDMIRRDASGAHVRLDVSGTARDEVSGEFLRLVYNGVIALGEDERKLFNFEEGAKTTEFGNIFTQVRFEADGPRLAPLANKLFVGSGRFVLEKDQPAIVEYRISEIVAGR